jgi:heme A synthase
MVSSKFARYAWGVLAVNIGVILWGAFVRATGSGAGCGSHWPLCNGVVIPRAPQIETLIEFTHRISSGLALLLVAGLLVWAFRAHPKGHPARLGAVLSMLFIITEALVGAVLVLFSWVAHDSSSGRVISISVHLVNTFLLLAALTLTAFWGSGGKPIRLRGQGGLSLAFLLGLLSVILLGVTGAVTALGDTLFPASSLQEGLAQDFSPSAHFLIRLRVWHPIIAILTGAYVMMLAGLIAMFKTEKSIRRSAIGLLVLFLVQLSAGLFNLVLLAPVWMQIIHLLLADLVWIGLILLMANTLSQVPEADTMTAPVKMEQPLASDRIQQDAGKL